MIDIASRLAPYRNHRAENDARKLIVGEQISECLAGCIGAVSFVVTIDHDGQIEASVQLNGKPATGGHVAALSRKMGTELPQQVTRIKGGGLIWTVPPKTLN
jgi:hypothetical protein